MALRRLGLSAAFALAPLALLVLLIQPLSAESSPPDPLASAGRLGLNQAWYIQHGYGDPTANLPPIAPAHFPSSVSPVQTLATGELDHHVYMPLVHTSHMCEARALWVARWDYSSITDVQTLVANAAGAGFNMLLFQVRGTADAFYTPGLEPWAARLSGTLGQYPGWDPLQTAVDAAHAHGLELHAYVNVYPVWRRFPTLPQVEPPPTSAKPEHLFWELSHRYTWDDWRVVDSKGCTMTLVGSGYLWATPALTDVADRVVSIAKDLVTRYDVDGVHLDLVRYPGQDYSHDPFTEAALGPSPLSRAEWQRRQVSQLVNRVYSEAITPGLRLSAAVWPVYQDRWGWNYSQGYSDYYQDSQGWVQSGTIDAIMPMIYPADAFASPDVFTPTQFSLLASDFLDHDGGRHVFPGISAQYDDFDQIAQRIAIARELGAAGHAIFSARLVGGNYLCAERSPCHDPYWDKFAAGPYALPATVPPLTWRQ